MVAVASPASWPSEECVESCLSLVDPWGFQPRLGTHAREQLGYLAGRDEDRLADLNEAIRDPEVRAIVTTRGGCGSSRLLRGVDVEALAADPKPLVGYSDITALHRVWHTTGVPSLHGAAAGRHAPILDLVLRGGTPPAVMHDPAQYGSDLAELDLDGHVLLLEINKAAGLGNVDRALTQLLMSGALDGVVGVAVGWLTGFEDYQDRGWSILDLLGERLGTLGVPVLAGLPFGHDPDPMVAPLGCRAPWTPMPGHSLSSRR